MPFKEFLVKNKPFSFVRKYYPLNLRNEIFSFWKCEGETQEFIYFSYGIDLVDKVARKKAFLECIERYFITFDEERDKKKIILRTYKELKERAVHPSLVFPFSNGQFSQRNFKYKRIKENDKICWVKGRSLLKNREIFVPAAAVYCRYKESRDEPRIGRATSNGCAIGTSLLMAILNGSLELIERDAVLIRWFNRLPSPRIPSAFLPKHIKHLLERVEENYQVEVLINDLTLDFKVPVISVLLRGKRPPYFTFGSGASFSVEEAIIKALQESLLKRYELKNSRVRSQPLKNFNYIQHLYQHSTFYAENNVFEAFKFLYKSPLLSKEKWKEYKNISQKFKTINQKINYLKTHVEELKTDLIFINLTPEELKVYNLYIVRVIIPGLLPLNSEYNARYLGCKRLYSLPAQLRLKKGIVKFLNKFPHPI
jgi:ribosomal protein S12 methylthiotransferase accessory factor